MSNQNYHFLEIDLKYRFIPYNCNFRPSVKEYEKHLYTYQSKNLTLRSGTANAWGYALEKAVTMNTWILI